mgnify:FL=1
MKHEVTSLNTKKTLAASLKKFMNKKPLSKITVSEIVADCKVNRKTFYYHFEDIYALLKWMLEEEAIEVVKNFDLIVDYEEAMIFVIDYVNENQHILSCAYDSMGREEMKRFFFADLIGVMEKVIDGAEKEYDCKMQEDYKKFVCNFYTEAITGMLIDWLKDKSVRDKEKTINYLSNIFHSSLGDVIKNAPKE